MKHVFRAVLVVSCVSTLAFAQEEEVELGGAIQVGPSGAAVVLPGVSANVAVTPGVGVSANVGVGTSVQVRARAQQTGVVVQTAPVVVREQVVVQQPVVVQERVVVQPVVQQRVVQQVVVARDCGTGPSDPGCVMQKNGRFPIDGAAFAGVLQTLRAQRNSIVREEMAKKMLTRHLLTAAQLGLVMDAFADHEITLLEVASALAPNVVNPQHALGHSTKFHNSISAEEYVEVISAQSPGY